MESPIYVKVNTCIDPASEEAESVLALADSIEPKLIAVVEKLLQRGEYASANSLLEKSIKLAGELRGLVGDSCGD